MIIETKNDVVTLSGSLHKNQWLTIKAAAKLLLQEHPQGIIVDCEGLEDISGDGAKTFLEAIRDIEAAKSRIIVANLPDNIFSVCKSIPGVRSSLPIANSIEEARASLRIANRHVQPAETDKSKGGSVLLVPLIAGLNLTYGAHLAGRLAKAAKGEVRLVYFLVVARNLPLNAPLLEEEQAAQQALAQAMQFAKTYNIPAWEHVERVRDATEGILTSAKTHIADTIVVGATSEPMGAEGHDTFHNLVDTLLQRAPCEVVIGRLKP